MKFNDFLNESTSYSNYVKNPFGCRQEDGTETSALLVLGESGVGKSVRIVKTLKESGHKCMYVHGSGLGRKLGPNNTFVRGTSLLYHEDIPAMIKRNEDLPPNIKLPSIYKLSGLSEFILEAFRDPSNYYTVVFEHVNGYIDVVEDELKQCLSSKFNGGKRYVFGRLFKNELPNDAGCSLIPDNLGFILVTSDENLLSGNDGMMNRLTLVNLDMSDRDREFTIDELLNIGNKSENDTDSVN